MASPCSINRCSALRSIAAKRYFNENLYAATLSPYIGWWALKSLSKITLFPILFKAIFVNLLIIMISRLPMELYTLIIITFIRSRRRVTAATSAPYNL